MKTFSLPRSLVAAAILSLLAACVDYTDTGYVERPVDQLYNSAMDTLHTGFFRDAADMFDEVERQHPYSSWATKAQLMSAYARYQNNDYDDAIIALDRFIQLHPSNRDITYAYYLKALSYYEQISDVTRDQKMTKLAMETLREITTRYPESRYARDAKIKIDLTNDHLSGKEMDIGRYYLRQGHYLASINRFKTVVNRYQTTTHVPEALHRLTEAYYALGIDDEARRTASVLGHNFPGSEWYIDSYETVENTQFRPLKDPAWYDVMSSKPIKHVKAMPPKSEDKWYKFWKGDEPANTNKPSKTVDESKKVVMKPPPKDRWYKFWGPPINAKAEAPKEEPKEEPKEPTPPAAKPGTPKGKSPAKGDRPWYRFW